MPATYDKIAVSNPTGGNSVTFSSIPSTYTDLIIVSSVRSSKTSDISDSYAIYFNSDTGTNYSATILRGDGSSASSFRNSSTTQIFVGEVATNQNGSGIFSPNIVHVMNYANTTTNKTVLSQNGGNSYVERVVGLWRSTSAINSITLKFNNSANSFVSGTTISLFGVKAA